MSIVGETSVHEKANSSAGSVRQPLWLAAVGLAGVGSYWHAHQAGQILLVTDGTGYTQEKGKPLQVLYKGDVIVRKPGVEHWHGTAPHSSMTHIAINPNTENGTVNWLKPVTDAEYPKQ